MSAAPAPEVPDFLLEVSAQEEGITSLEQARAWLSSHREEVTREVAAGKGYWFRGFPVRELEDFHDLIEILDPGLLPYSGAKVQNAEQAEIRLYSPTSTPRYRKNFLHNEMAYQRDIPSAITIFCQHPAPEGGESLVGDQRGVYRSIPEAIREKLERRKLKFVRYLQNRSRLQTFLSRHFDLFALMPSWQTNLGVESRAEAQELCESRGFECEWTPGGGLLISRVIDPSRPHPVTGEPMWVNNAHLFQLSPSVYGWFMYLLLELFFLVVGVPRTTCYYGDGGEIEEEVTVAILAATEANEVALPLRAGDFVYANNQTIGHGRTVFRGYRKLYFGVFA